MELLDTLTIRSFPASIPCPLAVPNSLDRGNLCCTSNVQVSGDTCIAGETILHETSLECCPVGDTLKCPGPLCRKWITIGNEEQLMTSKTLCQAFNYLNLRLTQSPAEGKKHFICTALIGSGTEAKSL